MGMGVPNHTDLNEELAAEQNSSATTAPLSDSSCLGDDRALTLEEKSEKALKCPCVADLVKGPCGEQFSQAFGCFFKSQKPDKASDCVEPYERMQLCMKSNAGEFTSASLSDAYKTAGGHTEEPAERKDSLFRKFEVTPPAVPEKDIRFPPWYLTQKPKSETPT